MSVRARAASGRADGSDVAPLRRIASDVALPSLRRLACVAAALVVGVAVLLSLAPHRVLAQAPHADCPQVLRQGSIDPDLRRSGWAGSA